jgi:hypothetical protein
MSKTRIDFPGSLRDGGALGVDVNVDVAFALVWTWQGLRQGNNGI